MAADPGFLRTPAEYTAGVCNIGPAEIERRRRFGDWGAVATFVLVALLRLSGAGRGPRLLVALPATVAAAGYLQAAQRFCAAFAWMGIFNFGARGGGHRVPDAAARTADRRHAIRLGAQAAALGLGVALLGMKGAGRRS